jgi:hypothetical protein
VPVVKTARASELPRILTANVEISLIEHGSDRLTDDVRAGAVAPLRSSDALRQFLPVSKPSRSSRERSSRV